ncbi:LuxR C-terminal-related transcriptional regulator [Noviherbaspirillum sp.]|uniref:LuxR C-terminal-related transcriptional regulator n=1 Tax=Noviherbaspirillum sp. TaxID=1926288 RepID=UPI002B4A35FB|nr:LuxR C-terminal-related transcriptional regulator [Noviherbaspirillum sp.]HJV80398.1 LuxR C-terminal-related transcriptional regulator [Noviherbaspirillum sp.]
MSEPAPTTHLNPTKFHPPPPSGTGVPRARLLAQLEQAVNVHLVLLLAPAGYGKTTLMGQWMERILRSGGQASWLTLDAADNDPARLLCYLQGTLREWMTLALGADEPAHAASADWMSLLDRIGPDAPQLTLFIDEFEHLNAGPTQRMVRLLAERLPRRVRLVISSRDKPPGLERFRLRGELLELTAATLSFDAAETQHFFSSRIAEPLGNWVIDKMQSVTNGWPAALQLTALAARTRDDVERYASDLSGSLANIADYLAEDVLHAQAEDIRNFLLETCCFPRLSAAVCDAATGRTDSQRMLRYLERHGLFTAPLDTGGTWYRYHPLFAAFLQNQQAHALAAEQIVAIHRGAARWFSRHGMAIEAVDLWLLAGDSAAAIREMSACAYELVMQAQFSTILRWIERLDDAALAAAGPQLALAVAWAYGFAGEPEAATQWLESLRQAVQADGADSPLQQEVVALEAALLALRGEVQSALALGLRHWDKAGARRGFAAGALANVVSYCLMLQGEFARARQFSDEARLCNEEIGSALGLGYALSMSGLIEASQGKLDQALQQFREVDRVAAIKLRHPWFEPTHMSVASVGLIASVLYEKDRLDEADELLQRYFPLVARQPSIDMLLLSHVVRTRIKMAQGDVDAALETLQLAERNCSASWRLGPARRIIEWERIRIDLLTGRSERALSRAAIAERAEAEQPAQQGASYVEELFGRGIEAMRCAIAAGRHEDALVRLAPEIARASASGRRWRQLKLTLLQTLALDAQGARRQAQATLVHALQLGTQIGARRSFIDEGKRIDALLRELPAQELASLPDAENLLRYWRDLRGDVGAAGSTHALLQANLSDRELAILRLLAVGMGNEQVAKSVFLSVNTVKWHIRRILEKLDARNRSEAVFIARRHGMIDV